MALYLRSTTVVTAGIALAGTAAYTIYKTGALRPVAVGAIRGGMKLSDWASEKYRSVSKGFKSVINEAMEISKTPAKKATSK